MDEPNVKNVYDDVGAKVVYEVMAFRALSEAELVMTIRTYLSGMKKPKRNTTVTITTNIGSR